MKNPVIAKLFHHSDVHYDRNYVSGTRTDCGLPVCCHETYGSGDAGLFGNYNCDSPEILVKAMLHQLSVHLPSYILYSGDTPAHDLWMQTHESNVGAILNLTQWTLEALPSNTKYFPVLGNHAAAPVDEFGGPLKDYWLYGPVGDSWMKFLPREAIVSFKWGGYYTAVMEPGLRVIGLQTNYYDTLNKWLDPTNPDIAGQFAWLEDVLSQVDALGEKVIILGHEKPSSFSPDPWQSIYLNLVAQYQHIIVASLFGHSHHDFFQVLHYPDSNGTQPMGVALLCSSLTPDGNASNPSFRVYTYDQKSKALLDYTHYRFGLAQGNKDGKIVWQEAYSALKDYNIPDLSASSWQTVGERIGSDVNYWKFFLTVYFGGLQEYHPPEGLDSNQRLAMCRVLGDSDVNYNLCVSG
eukprot:TRINITY_DN15941_c0_g1_i1.p1 TRINITY_DN15941_c0_g1~~TRINITY_DN15941_c0_g1_i1.p1  ORF type:complete len:468 (-),score=79.69 TRINITY_DN15941_c0_g1_i1:78-1301(-)